MDNRNLHSQSLDLLRFPLAVIVVLIHVFAAKSVHIAGTEHVFNSTPLLAEANLFIGGLLRGQSVPIYFFISGYVFFMDSGWASPKYGRKLKNRAKTLFIPYVIWNSLAVVLRLILISGSLLLPGMVNEATADLSLTAILSCFWDASKGVFASTSATAGSNIYPVNFPLWFVRDLMVVVLCTPLLYHLLRQARHHAVMVLGAAWFVLGYWDLGYAYMLLTAFFFFSWGAYMSMGGKDMVEEFGRFFSLSCLLYPLLSLLFIVSAHYFPELSETIKRLNILVGLLFAYNLSAWLLRRDVCKVNTFLSSASYFIYVAHALLYTRVLKLLYHFTYPASEGGIVCLYLSTVIITVCLLLLTFYLLKRFTPKILKVLVGRK